MVGAAGLKLTAPDALAERVPDTGASAVFVTVAVHPAWLPAGTLFGVHDVVSCTWVGPRRTRTGRCCAAIPAVPVPRLIADVNHDPTGCDRRFTVTVTTCDCPGDTVKVDGEIVMWVAGDAVAE